MKASSYLFCFLLTFFLRFMHLILISNLYVNLCQSSIAVVYFEIQKLLYSFKKQLLSLKSPLTWFPFAFILAHSTPVDMPSRGQNEDRDSGIARSGIFISFYWFR